MNFLTKWFLDNPVAANLLMAFTIIAGVLSFSSLRVESFPQIPPSQLVVEVFYPGGTAKQVDEGITQRIEDAVSGVAGIKNVTSASYARYASIRIKKNTGVDLDKLMEEVRNQVESIVGFPEKAQRPKIYRDEYGNLASFIMVYGGSDDNKLQDVATSVQNALKKHPEISKVTNLGKRQKQLVIEPDLDKLRQYGLDLEQLNQLIHQWSLEYRSGELKTARGTITLRGDSFADNLKALKNVPLVSNAHSIVRLSDVASVRRDFVVDDSLVRFKGQSAIALMISTSQKDNLLNVSEATKEVLDSIKPTLPTYVQTEVMADMAPYIDEQLSLLSTNAWQGLLIVMVVLGLFLEMRLAFWVAMGIPISLAGAVWLMGLPQFDYSINDITLFGMILVLGILVDDAVVVGESIHTARKKFSDPKEAAWRGVKSVSVATMFGVLTTIAAFSPMLWIENELAQVLAGFSAVVIFALIFSLIESKFILPSHLVLNSSDKNKTNVLNKGISRLRNKCTNGLQWFSDTVYEPILRLSLQHKGTSLVLFLTLVLGAYAAMLQGSIKTVFFPEIPGRFATLTVTMDQDAALELTKLNVSKIEKGIVQSDAILRTEYELTGPAINKHLVSMEGASKIEANLELSNEALSKVPSNDFLEIWQKVTGQIEGSYATKYTLAEEPAGGTVISVSAPSRDVARQVAMKLKTSLKEQPGVNNVFDDSQSGKKQLKVTLNQRGVQLGLDQRKLASLVGGAFGRHEIHRLLDKGEELLVVMRLPENDRKTIQQLKDTSIHLQGGRYVKLGEVTDFTYSREPEVLYRRNQDEVVSIYWRQDRTITSPQEVWQQVSQNVVPNLEQQYPGVKISAQGEFEEILDVQQGFKKAMLLTLLLIFVLLAIPLKSYWQPFIIMSVIPFGFAGAIYGHGLMDLSVSLLSLFGMMAMTGVVINDSLVLMTRFNQLVESGMEIKEALITAGKSRMRAIFLTTVTTVCGLLPLLSETSEQAQYLKPAAVSLVFGELFATPITLILIPVLLSFGKYKKPVSVEQAQAQLV